MAAADAYDMDSPEAIAAQDAWERKIASRLWVQLAIVVAQDLARDEALGLDISRFDLPCVSGEEAQHADLVESEKVPDEIDASATKRSKRKKRSK